MTIKEVTHQLFNLSVAGYFNGEKFTKSRLEGYIRTMTQGDGSENLVMEIAMPDGRWFFEITRLPKVGKYFYDYFIPQNREQEKILVNLITAGVQ